MQSRRSSSRPALSFVFLVALSAAFLAPSHAQTTPVRVLIAGRAYTGTPPAQLVGGEVWGPVAPLVRLWGARLIGPETGPRVELRTADGRGLVISTAKPHLLVEGREVALAQPPRLGAGGHLYAPLAPLFSAMGARVSQPTGKPLFLGAATVRKLEFLRGSTGLVVRLVTTAPVQGTVQRLADPDRAYIDLPGLAVTPAESVEYLGVGGVWRLRWSQFDAESFTARFVLDLREAQPVRWVATPDGGRLEVGSVTGDEEPFVPERPRLESVSLAGGPDGEERAVLRLSAPAEFTYTADRNPYRLTLNFPYAQAVPFSTRGALSGLIRSAEVCPRGDRGVDVVLSFGWALRYSVQVSPEGQELTVSLRRDLLAGKRIVVDPGHGGRDPGAQARGLKEKDVNFAVARLLVARLGAAGAIPLLTRDSDVYVPLEERPRLATALEADAFVSIHCNAMPRPNMNHGTESYYFTPQSRQLANLLQDSLCAGLGRRDNGVRQRRFAVLWRSQQPCALVELMYLDWDAEGSLLRLPQVQQNAAEAVFTALRAYFEGMPLTPEGCWPPGGKPLQPGLERADPASPLGAERP